MPSIISWRRRCSVSPAVGHTAVAVRVLLDVGVQEVERGPADVGPPHLGVARLAGEVDDDAHALAQRDSQGVRVERREALLLPAVEAEVLAEVAVLVEEADADERDAHVRRRLEVVAGQDAEAAGVLGQGFGDAELGGEVRHEAQRALEVLASVLEPAWLVEVAAQVAVAVAHLTEEAGVAGVLLELVVVGHRQRAQRVVAGLLPCLGVDPPIELTGAPVPAPPQVHGHALERAQGLGQAGFDAEAAKCFHGVEPSWVRCGHHQRAAVPSVPVLVGRSRPYLRISTLFLDDRAR
jgi:hypothetical protein